MDKCYTSIECGSEKTIYKPNGDKIVVKKFNEYEKRRRFTNHIKFYDQPNNKVVGILFACNKCGKMHQSRNLAEYCYKCSYLAMIKHFPSRDEINKIDHGVNDSCGLCSDESILFSVLFFPIFHENHKYYLECRTREERNRYIKLYRSECVYSNITGDIISCEGCDKKFNKFKSSDTNKCVTCVILQNKKFTKCDKIYRVKYY